MVKGQTEFQVNLKLGLDPMLRPMLRPENVASVVTFAVFYQDIPALSILVAVTFPPRYSAAIAMKRYAGTPSLSQPSDLRKVTPQRIS